LVAAVLSQLNMKSVDELIPWAYSDRNPSWQKFADLAPLASKCISESNDQVALQILDNAVNELLVRSLSIS
jgi:N-acetylglucosamine kinase-like BadF-type ATPase